MKENKVSELLGGAKLIPHTGRMYLVPNHDSFNRLLRIMGVSRENAQSVAEPFPLIVEFVGEGERTVAVWVSVATKTQMLKDQQDFLKKNVSIGLSLANILKKRPRIGKPYRLLFDGTSNFKTWDSDEQRKQFIEALDTLERLPETRMMMGTSPNTHYVADDGTSWPMALQRRVTEVGYRPEQEFIDYVLNKAGLK